MKFFLYPLSILALSVCNVGFGADGYVPKSVDTVEVFSTKVLKVYSADDAGIHYAAFGLVAPVEGGMHLYEPDPGSPSGMVEITRQYGTKTADTIDVGVIGAGVENRGIYHLKAGTSAIDAISMAGISNISNGHFQVERGHGKDHRIVLRVDAKDDPALRTFKLQTGDIVFAGERLL